MSSLPILTYHRILAGEPTLAMDPHRISVSQRQFCRHLEWLSRLGYQTVSLEGYIRDLRSGKGCPPRRLAITFDDGYQDVFTLGLPVLKQFGYQATVFAVASEECNRWDDGAARLIDRKSVV